MNVLFCASEAAPFAASGGLGDVAGSLPRAIRNRKVACRVVMPLYGDMKQEYREKLTYITNFTVPVGWRNQYCGLFELTHNGVKYYFLDNEYYFKRTGLYGFYDDGERFAFFSRAILEMLFHVDFVPDVIHANDWQTALVPVYLNLYYRHLEQYRSIKTVFTIHNIQYQGKYGMEILEDTLAIGRQDAHLVEYDGCVNFMKGAIECADKVTTVSPSYAGEILDPGTATAWTTCCARSSISCAASSMVSTSKATTRLRIPILRQTSTRTVLRRTSPSAKKSCRRFSACTIGLFRWWPWSRGWWATRA